MNTLIILDYEGGITIPLEQYTSNPRFAEHMKELERYAHYDAARGISPELGEALKYGQQTNDYGVFNETFNKLIDETTIQVSTGMDDQGLGQKLQNFMDGTWRKVIYHFQEKVFGVCVMVNWSNLLLLFHDHWMKC